MPGKDATMPARRDTPSEVPDELSPEWTEYESTWAVAVADFGNPVEAARFLSRRKAIFRAAQKLGIDKDMLTGFEPNKPGFEKRVHDAFEALAAIAAGSGLAAE